MRPLIAKIKPANGFSRLAHVGLNVLLVLLLLALVRIDFFGLALGLILLSKWRMFAVRPRFWLIHIRTNAVDIIVGVSLLLFMAHAASAWIQVMWATLYLLWLLVIKPASNGMVVAVQAMAGLLLGLSALFIGWGDGALYWLVLISGLICYMAARHFLDVFDEPYARLLSYLWAYFAAAVTWVLCHWLLFYGFWAQPTLLLVAVGYGLAALYYLDHHDRLSKLVRVEIVVTTAAIILAVVVSLVINVMNTVHVLLR